MELERREPEAKAMSSFHPSYNPGREQIIRTLFPKSFAQRSSVQPSHFPGLHPVKQHISPQHHAPLLKPHLPRRRAL